MQEIWVRALGREDPLEKEMATHSSIHAWEILWTEESGGLVHGITKEWDTTEQLNNNNTTTTIIQKAKIAFWRSLIIVQCMPLNLLN